MAEKPRERRSPGTNRSLPKNLLSSLWIILMDGSNRFYTSFFRQKRKKGKWKCCNPVIIFIAGVQQSVSISAIYLFFPSSFLYSPAVNRHLASLLCSPYAIVMLCHQSKYIKIISPFFKKKE